MRAALLLLLFFPISLLAQIETDKDALFIKEIHDHALTNGKAYEWLEELTSLGGRLSGSEGADKAVLHAQKEMGKLGFDKVLLQPCLVKEWHRNGPSTVKVVTKGLEKTLPSLALGNSVGNGPDGVTAEVIEVQGLDEVRALGRAGIEGKIVFYNRPMDPSQLNTFNAYGGAVDQRVFGASVAAEYGGLAAVVRSMSINIDPHPHTGTMTYAEGVNQVPGICISTQDAEYLSGLLKKQKVELHVQTTCAPGKEKVSYNVIGEITGSTYPEEIILVGGHLDSWDVSGGAHDDGAGCAHSMQVIQTLKELDYKPKRTIRCVLFMNEENGLAGAQEYARKSNGRGEYHMAALESDSGGFVPRGFKFEADTSVFKKKYAQVSAYLPLLEPYGLQFSTGGSGADVGPLKSQKGLLIGLSPDSQRYFDFHHTAVDNIEAVNKRELELGAAAMTSLIYLLDKYGLK